MIWRGYASEHDDHDFEECSGLLSHLERNELRFTGVDEYCIKAIHF